MDYVADDVLMKGVSMDMTANRGECKKNTNFERGTRTGTKKNLFRQITPHCNVEQKYTCTNFLAIKWRLAT